MSAMNVWVCFCVLLAGASARGQTNGAAGPVKPFEDTLGMRFVKVPGARVMFSVWETRVRDYEVFAAETRREWRRPEFKQSDADPAVNVTWDDAAAFCQWLTARERKAGRLADKQRYRLPTDAEWSAAAGLGPERGRTPEDRLQAAVVWPWGCSWPPQSGAGNYGQELEADTFTNTSPAGSFKANAFQLFDLGGNAWEWCEDWYNDARVTKVLRGGSFHDNQPQDLLAAYRFSGTVHLSNDDIGFRAVLEEAAP